MKELYFIPSSRMTEKVKSLLLSEQWIVIEGVQYHQVMHKPPGWVELRRLVQPETGERIILFK